MGVLDRFLVYHKPRSIVIDSWQVGAVYRLLQLAIFVYVALYMYFYEASWAYSEVPMGSFNAWGSSEADVTAKRNPSSFTYCGNESYSFVYWEPGWNYGTPPECRPLSANEVAVKGLGNVFFTTVYIEFHKYGWVCSDAAADATQRADCTARGGGVTAHPDGQCECSTSKAYYPMSVEVMHLKMEIAYRTTHRFGGAAGSTTSADGDSPLPVTLVQQNGEQQDASGGTVSLTVAQWLSVAGISLEDTVTHTPDYRYDASRCAQYDVCGLPMHYPRFRTTGVYLGARSQLLFWQAKAHPIRIHRPFSRYSASSSSSMKKIHRLVPPFWVLSQTSRCAFTIQRLRPRAWRRVSTPCSTRR